METRPIAITIRTKKIGVLIRGARLAAGKSLEECAQAIGASSSTLEAYERGETSPTLPELEALAYYLKTPLAHFWGREIASASKPETPSDNPLRLLRLRNHIIGALFRQARLEAGLSPKDVADRAGITEEMIESYELGEQPIPLPELEVLANAVNRPIKDFQDSRGPIGTWIRQQHALQYFAELSPDLQDFISKPVNRPYLELAQRLSEMSVEKLRTVAEGLLEITL